MGTRHLIMVKLNKETKVAQYGQWDGYLNGQGKDIATFLQSKEFSLSKLKKAVNKLQWATPEMIKQTWVNCGASPNSDMVTMKVSDIHAKRYPEFSRDTSAKLLPLIQSGQVTAVEDSRDFLKDGLFCEYAYEIDLDKETVYVYVGGKKLARGIKFENFTVERMERLQTKLNEE